MNGGDGSDWAEYNQATMGIHVDLSLGMTFDDGQAIGTARSGLGDGGYAPGDSVEQDTLISIENIIGGFGHDLIIGDDGVNTLLGSAGDDTIEARGGDDSIDGGSGADLAVFRGIRADYDVTVNVATGEITVVDKVTGRDGTDRLTGVEWLAFTDQRWAPLAIIGTEGPDELHGTPGDDVILALGGDDTIHATTGSDWIDGGDAGRDVLVLDYRGWSSPITRLNLADTGVAHFDEPQAVDLYGAFGTQYIGRIDAFQISLTTANDRVDGSSTHDTIEAGDGNDWIDAASGNDQVFGGQGDDWLYGSYDTDTIFGGAGNDTLGGGEGDDTLDGGDGYDLARFGQNDGQFPENDPFTLDFRSVNWSATTFQITDANGQTDTLTSIEAVLVEGSPGGDTLYLSPGDDVVWTDARHGSASSDDFVDGREGFDSVGFLGRRDEYTVTFEANAGRWIVTDQVSDRNGNETLVSIERLMFNDGSYLALSDGTLLREEPGFGGFFKVDPAGTWLADPEATSPADPAPPATEVALTAFGAGAGDLIILSRRGDYKAGNDSNFSDNSSSMVAHFVDAQGNRLMPAVFLPHTTTTQTSSAKTDIAEDFWVSSGLTQVQVPEGASALRFSVNDSDFIDNTDPDNDFGVRLGLLNGQTNFSGWDLVFGTPGNDSLEGREGNDSLAGGPGDDTLVGNTGDDRFWGGPGSDVLDGGEQKRVPWQVSTAGDYDRLDYGGTAGITVDLAARTVSVTGEEGLDLFTGIEEIHGAFNGSDAITGRLTASAADAADGTGLYLYLRGGSDTVTQTGYGPQQPWADGVIVAYHWSTTPINLVYEGNTATVTYGASGSQAAGLDTLVNVGVVGDSAQDDHFDFSQAITNQAGYATSAYHQASWHTVLMGRGGSDTVIGNGLTNLHFGAVDRSADGRGVVLDLKLGEADLLHLSSGGNPLGTVTYTGVRGFTGTRFNDTLIGGNADNNGFESFRGDGGDDFIDGGQGFDRASYRWSGDAITVDLAAGAVSSGSSGHDTLRSIEQIQGSMFDDWIDVRGFGDADAMNVGSFWNGLNVIVPEGGNDTIHGNGVTQLDFEGVMVGVHADLSAGFADALDPQVKSSPQYGTLGRDTFSGVYGLRGSSNDDWLVGGGAGHQSSYVGLEVFYGGAGHDTLDGSWGVDIAIYQHDIAGIEVDLSQGTARDGWGFVDTLISIEAIGGSHFADVMIGSDNPDGESFIGRRGADSIDGGAGPDDIDFGDDEAGVVVRLSGWVGDASSSLPTGYTGSAIDGYGDIDVFTNIEGVEGSEFDDVIHGDDGDNRLDGRGGSDVINGGLGVDWVEYNQAMRPVHVNLADGLAYDDGQGRGWLQEHPDAAIEQDALFNIENVQGGYGDDRLMGDAGPNELDGFHGHDVLDGAAGADTLRGDRGDDTLVGGDGFDQAVFAGMRSEYEIWADVDGLVHVVDQVADRDGHDVLSGIKSLVFSDLTVPTPEPGAGVGGVAYHWKSHALLPGVEVSAFDAVHARSDPGDLFDLRNVRHDAASGKLTVEVWAHPSEPAGSFDFTVSAPQALGVVFTPSLSESVWTVIPSTISATEIDFGAFVNAIGTEVTGAVKLGELKVDLEPGRMDGGVLFSNVEVGNAELPDRLLHSVGHDSSDGSGAWQVAPLPDGAYALNASRAVGDGSANSGISSADALAALRIAVGLNPNPDPDGAAGPALPLPISPYQIMAADVNGSGTVTSADALAILRMAVRLSTAVPQEWLFVEETRDFWNEGANGGEGAFTLSRTNASWDRSILFDLPEDAATNLVGILKGDVNGSWKNDELPKLDAGHIPEVAELIGVPVTQWGLVLTSISGVVVEG